MSKNDINLIRSRVIEKGVFLIWERKLKIVTIVFFISFFLVSLGAFFYYFFYYSRIKKADERMASLTSSIKSKAQVEDYLYLVAGRIKAIDKLVASRKDYEEALETIQDLSKIDFFRVDSFGIGKEESLSLKLYCQSSEEVSKTEDYLESFKEGKKYKEVVIDEVQRNKGGTYFVFAVLKK